MSVPSLPEGMQQKDDEDSCFWHVGTRVLGLGKRPCIMGILNLTPDSFSDGNSYPTVQAAVDRALQMEAEGADIIDVGGESTRPSASPVSVGEELRRVLPVLDRLAGRLKIPLSIDTFKAAVARDALKAGAEIVNDISSLTFDPEMAAVVASSNAGLVLMHTRGRPAEMQLNTHYDNLIAEIREFLLRAMARAETIGIDKMRVVIDPGVGFAKSCAGNLEIIRRLDLFSDLGRPLLLGTSRKSFIGRTIGHDQDQRLFGTAATVAVACAHGARIFRVHDVKPMRAVADMAFAIMTPDTGC